MVEGASPRVGDGSVCVLQQMLYVAEPYASLWSSHVYRF